MTGFLRLFRRTFSSLGTRNYRLFFVGQTVSIVGTWMQRVAQDWLILELGGGPIELAIGVGLQSVPSLLLGMYGGVLADRAELRRLMLWTQTFFALLSATLGVLALTNNLNIPLVYVFAFLMGCANVIDKPARQSFVVQMVGTNDVVNAISLNSSINNASRLIGPAIAGVIIGFTNTGVTFLVNSATFFAIIAALVVMDPGSLTPRLPAPRKRGQVMEGLRYAMADPGIRPVLLSTLIVSNLAQNFRVLLPLFVVDVLAGGASGYGLLMSMLGLGALGGALACAGMNRPTQRLVTLQLLGFGFMSLLAALAPTYVVLAALMIGVGAGSTSFNTTSQSLVLLHAEDDKRGRIMSLRQMFSNALTPVGALLIGWVCEVSSPRYGFVVGAGAALAGAAVVWRPKGARSDPEISRDRAGLASIIGEEQSPGAGPDDVNRGAPR